MWNPYPGAITAAILAFSTVSTVVTNPASRTCAEAANDRQRLRVRMVTGTQDQTVIAQARAEVEAIWRRYGVDLIWELSPEPRDMHARPDLWVVFVDGHLPSGRARGASTVASMLFDNGSPTHHVRVSTAAARALLATKSWTRKGRALSEDPPSIRRDVLGRVIGRALAHEIGHYLLASPHHADRGLMRAAIDPEQLVTPGATFLTLRDADVRALRAARVSNCTATQ